MAAVEVVVVAGAVVTVETREVVVAISVIT